MALAARPAFCRLMAEKTEVEIQKAKVVEVPAQAQVSETYGKIVLQPRLCTLRSFAGERGGVMKQSKNSSNVDVSRFFETLSDYIESSKKSRDFEIISGRLAMIIFSATLSIEVVTGNSVFRKLDGQGISEAVGISLVAVTGAALFAWFSSARTRVGPMFTSSCNTFIDSLIDQIIDGLFYDFDIHDWSDDI
ncbi:stress enhanced protein 2, chloroplastic [Dorcoceras hygrometricum]|uniref:Stress enhanced protein 2, chloroplastic n=1 Tax=Dorcoceras hygrometricum TaxID=472368 RepID=A0A2Z7A578_9LAMI|nr:stress enhanced protein 2, chloroplastic [Dorcoceras hygrometricum]